EISQNRKLPIEEVRAIADGSSVLGDRAKTLGLIDEIGVPDKEVRGYKSEHDYRLLENDGIISPETEVGEEDVQVALQPSQRGPVTQQFADPYSLSLILRFARRLRVIPRLLPVRPPPSQQRYRAI
ncbi:MAG: DNA-directed RNA polymerase, partial [Candidatus Wolfebacteria bacterium GW2011_GWA1_47_6]